MLRRRSGPACRQSAPAAVPQRAAAATLVSSSASPEAADPGAEALQPAAKRRRLEAATPERTGSASPGVPAQPLQSGSPVAAHTDRQRLPHTTQPGILSQQSPDTELAALPRAQNPASSSRALAPASPVAQITPGSHTEQQADLDLEQGPGARRGPPTLAGTVLRSGLCPC